MNHNYFLIYHANIPHDLFFFQTPLYLAVSANQPEMVAMLIDYRADVNIPAEVIMINRPGVVVGEGVGHHID